jgi:exopolyphosphatase / guanosine-5'-triphosphate,3'-diphosphate pyrophosphatase
MAFARRAVIDVGTNSVKLLVADVSDHEVRPVLEDSKQTRLGRGFYETHRLQPEPIAKTARAVAAFAGEARALQAAHIRLIATSAAREALNGAELVGALESAAGLPAEIISGEQEADWAFLGVTTDPALARVPLLLLDVGGGSSEFILGQGTQKHFRRSFRLGTVRLLETIPPSDPPTREEFAETRRWVREFVAGKVRPELEPALRREVASATAQNPVQIVGTGGTTSILARMELALEDYDRERIEAVRLSQERVNWHAERLWSLPLAQRQELPGLPRKRADVILAGAVIYEAVMAEFGFGELRVSTRGLRFAAVMEDAVNRVITGPLGVGG